MNRSRCFVVRLEFQILESLIGSCMHGRDGGGRMPDITKQDSFDDDDVTKRTDSDKSVPN
jgi:hypothetical protein